MAWKPLARRSHGIETSITESIQYGVVGPDGVQPRRFTATIRGFRSWRLWEGPGMQSSAALPLVRRRVEEIRERIDSGDESVFHEPSDIRIRPVAEAGPRAV